MEQNRKKDTDHALIDRFRKGSMEAMEKIVSLYEGRIFNFGMKMCGHLQDAEDITQETFLNAFKSLHQFRGETKLKNWLFKIAAHACIRKRRKKKCEPDRELSLDALLPHNGPGETYDIPDWSNDPSDALIRSELKEVIDSAVGGLPPRYRLVFNLRDIEGFSTEETASILDISPQAVKTRLHRARLFLRKTISEHYKGAPPDA